MAEADATTGASKSDPKTLSTETVQTLSKMIKELEDQLDRMLAINDALEKDVAQERKQRVDLERKLDGLETRLLETEQSASSIEDLQAEVAHLNSERSKLATTVEELGRQISDTTKENRQLAAMADRMRAERDDALEELSSVEAQFERAMEMVTDLRTRLEVLAEERDALKGRHKMLEQQLAHAEQERDSMLAEVDDSKKALEEIRRSLVDACVTSPNLLEPTKGSK